MNAAPRADQAIAEFVASTPASEIPADVLDATRWLLIDSFACAFAATSFLPEIDALDGARPVFGDGSASTLIGLGELAAPATAAFVNGGLVHGLNYDALGAGYAHIASGTVPATLAVAEASGSSGRDLLAAIALAGEVSSRLTLAADDPLSTRGWLMGQLLAVFSSAVGAARADGLDASGTASALGIALMQASGTMQVMADGGAQAKSVYASFPALNGVVAATLAKGGIDGKMDVFGGSAGLFGRFLPEGDPSVLTEGLGHHWYASALAFKRWPNTAVAHPFLQALVEADPQGRRPKGVTFRVDHGRAAFFDPERTAWRPTNVGVAGNSVPYAVACYLADGAFGLDSLRAEAFGSPPVLALLDHTSVEWRDGEAAEMEISFEDGPPLTLPVRADHDGAAQPGEDLVEKLRACARRARRPLSDKAVAELIAAVIDLEQAEDLSRLQLALAGIL